MLRISHEQAEALDARFASREVARMAELAAPFAEALDAPPLDAPALAECRAEAMAAGLTTVGEAAGYAVLSRLAAPRLAPRHQAWINDIWRSGRHDAPRRLELILMHLQAGRHRLGD